MEPNTPGRKIEIKSATTNSVKLVETPMRCRSRAYALMCVGVFPVLVASGLIKGGLPEVPPLVIASLGLPFVLVWQQGRQWGADPRFRRRCHIHLLTGPDQLGIMQDRFLAPDLWMAEHQRHSLEYLCRTLQFHAQIP